MLTCVDIGSESRRCSPIYLGFSMKSSGEIKELAFIIGE